MSASSGFTLVTCDVQGNILICMQDVECLLFCLVSKELDRQQYIYTKGCVGQFEKWLQDNLIFVAGIFVGIALLQVRLLSLKPCVYLKLI